MKRPITAGTAKIMPITASIVQRFFMLPHPPPGFYMICYYDFFLSPLSIMILSRLSSGLSLFLNALITAGPGLINRLF